MSKKIKKHLNWGVFYFWINNINYLEFCEKLLIITLEENGLKSLLMKSNYSISLKIIIFVLTVFLSLALIFGIAGAFLQTKRTSLSTINFDKGIVIEYSGFQHSEVDTDNIWQKNEISFQLFSVNNALPGTQIEISEASFKPAGTSIDFYARFKLDYKFYSDLQRENEILNVDPEKVLIASDNFINSAWVENILDGYYYFATITTLNLLSPEDSLVSFFEDGASYLINPEIEGVGFGYEVDGELIKRIDVILTLEVADNYESWTAIPPPAYFNSNWKNLLGTDNNGTETGMLVSNIKTIEFATTMPTDEEYNLNQYICVGAVGRGTTSADQVVNDSVIAYYYMDTSNLYHLAIVGAIYPTINTPINASGLFKGLSALTTIEFGNLDTTGTTTFASAFYQCTKLKTIIGMENWNVSKVTSMGSMFYSCAALTLNNDTFKNWKTNSLTNISYMFALARNVNNLNLSYFNVSRVTNMEYIFSTCQAMQSLNLSNWNLAAISKKDGIFNNCSNLSKIQSPASIKDGVVLSLPYTSSKTWIVEGGDGTAVVEIGNDTTPKTLGETIVVQWYH